ncbi:MAG: TonB-dependent receptor [Bryobacteraceae bacterium]
MKNITNKIVFAMLLMITPLFGQSGAVSQISGTVRDPSGLAVPGASVTVTHTDTGLARTAETGADGVYLLPSLPVGAYRIDVKKEGFTSYTQSGIILQVNSNPTIDVTLSVGSITQQVQVEAAATMVESYTTGVGQVVDQQRVVDLPLNDRLATQLITLAGAAINVPTADVGQLSTAKNYPNEAVISVAGGPANGLTFSLDGASYNDPVNSANLPLPFPDALQEFKVETSALPAQYGQHSGGAVNVVTRSGSNQFHGDAFEFLRNGDLNARDTFALSRDTLRRNQFGGVLGGPIKKNKLFFFVGYQGTVQRSDASTGITYEPTPSMLQGNFTDITSPACNGGKQITLPEPFVNNQISPSLLNSAALKMMALEPTTNDPCGKVQYSLLNNFSEQAAVAKVDYQLSTKNSIFLRYTVSHSFAPPSYTGTLLSISQAAPDDMVNSVVIGESYVLSPNMINTFHADLNRAAVTKTQVLKITAQDLGINLTEPSIPDNIYVTVSGALSSVGINSFPAIVHTTSHQLSDDFSIIHGTHEIQFGANWIRPSQNAYFPGTSGGSFNFSGQFTGLPMADFLLGDAASFSQASLEQDFERQQYLGLYVQDSWRVTSRLRVNVGLRWEPYFGSALEYGWTSHFSQALYDQDVHSTVYPNAPAGVQYPGDPGFQTNNRPSNVRWLDFAPRAGLVWDPTGDGKTTIRASWGIFYDMPHTLFYDGMAGVPPWGTSAAIVDPPGGFLNPWQSFPGGNPFPISLGSNARFLNGGNYFTVPLNIAPTYLEQWNLSFQHQFAGNWLASASYLGNNTIHLWAAQALDYSQYLPGASCVINGTSYAPCSSLANTAVRSMLRLQNPTQGAYFNTLTNLDDGATASYNAMLLSLQHRLANHFTILANYTYSHCISDPVTTLLGGSYTDPTDRRFDRGNCAGIDIRHNVNVSAVLTSPQFSERWLRVIAGNWQLSPILGAHTGSYFSVTTGVDNALNNITGQRPNLVSSNAYCANKSANCWILPTAFADAATGTLGSSGANSLLGPGYFQVDVSLSRKIRITERQSIEIRADAFNIANRVNLNLPNTTLNGVNFGKVTSDITAVGSASGDPRILQLALKYAF